MQIFDCFGIIAQQHLPNMKNPVRMKDILLIQHRVNHLSQLMHLPAVSHGYECDIRYESGIPVLSHEIEYIPYMTRLDTLLRETNGLYCILNIKETGGEAALIQLATSNKAYPLLLDLTMPASLQLVKLGLGHHIMWRVSEYEKPSPRMLEELGAKWIWLDSFSDYWFQSSDLLEYRKLQIGICLVSNELQGRPISAKSAQIASLVKSGLIQMICTKDTQFYCQEL